MELQENSLKFIIIHPILIALYPVFFVYSQNIHLILIQGIIFPVLIILGITIAMWAITRSILKNTRKSALLTSLFVFLFFFIWPYFQYFRIKFESRILFLDSYVSSNYICFDCDFQHILLGKNTHKIE